MHLFFCGLNSIVLVVFVFIVLISIMIHVSKIPLLGAGGVIHMSCVGHQGVVSRSGRSS